MKQIAGIRAAVLAQGPTPSMPSVLRKILAGCGAGVFSLLTVIPAHAQEVATLVLRDGQRPSGELVDLNASGFTLQVGGQMQQFSANDVAAVEFVGGAPPAAAQARIDAGQPLIVLRNGQIVEGRLSDIGGTHPLRLTIDTAGGSRDYTSNDVAQIYRFATARAAAAAPPAQTNPGQGRQDPNTRQPRGGQQQPQDPNTRQPRRGQRQPQQDQNYRQQPRGQGQQQNQNFPQQGRLSQQRQRQLVDEQQQRLTAYRQRLDAQQRILQQQAALSQRQGHTAQYRVQQDYLNRLRQQQTVVQNERPDYDRDPYFYTAPSYRYSRGGRTYETNDYGADLLEQAVDFGYAEGVRNGEADRQDRSRSAYQATAAYQDADYGYKGYYVDIDDYNFYFREGFRRGYEDGYNRRSQYGHNNNGSYTVLDSVLSQILDFQSIR